MAGYLFPISVQRVVPTEGKEAHHSPVLAVKTMRRIAVETFEKKLRGLKSTGCKMGDVEELELIPFETNEKESQVYMRSTGTDKAGNPVTLYLERYHVGGQAAERGLTGRGG